MSKVYEYEELIKKHFKGTLSIIDSNEIFKIHDRYLGEYTTISYGNLYGVSPSTKGYFYGSLNSAFSGKTIEKDYVQLPMSTYSGDRTLEEMKIQAQGILKALEVLNKLEKVYNEERIEFQPVYKEYKERQKKESAKRREHMEEIDKSSTKGDDSIYQIGGVNPQKVFNGIFQFYYNRNIQEDSVLLNNKLQYNNNIIVGGDSGILIKGKSEYAIKLNIHGFDLCTKDGKGVKELYRRGKDKLSAIEVVHKIFDKDSKRDRDVLYKILRYVYDGQKDRKFKQGIVQSIK